MTEWRRADPGQAREELIPKHGGYRKLKTFQIARLVYDVTVRFCNRYIDRRSRTHDQMVQAARSGVQNIAEGSVAAGTSRKTELKLTNVARASLEELRLDYEDFLRQRGRSLWARDDPRRKALVERRCTSADEVAAWVREIARRRPDGARGLDGTRGLDGPNGLDGPHMLGSPSAQSIQSIQAIESSPPPPPSPPAPPTPLPLATLYAELSANAALVLIGVTLALLDRQLAAQGRAFEQEGGFTERLYRVRLERRRRS